MGQAVKTAMILKNGTIIILKLDLLTAGKVCKAYVFPLIIRLSYMILL